ncbi:hypothetical protein HMPREF3214_00027 [Alloscardovia omnicolens]|nr:hypothetical protein HMPREF3214_00027 [Alloscardovia omnicolens]
MSLGCEFNSRSRKWRIPRFLECTTFYLSTWDYGISQVNTTEHY